MDSVVWMNVVHGTPLGDSSRNVSRQGLKRIFASRSNNKLCSSGTWAQTCPGTQPDFNHEVKRARFGLGFDAVQSGHRSG